MTEDWCCPICLEENEEDCYTLQPCNHKFHTKCIIDSLRLRGRECPCCRGIQTTSNNFQNNQNAIGNDIELFNAYINYGSNQIENLPFNENSNLNIIDISGVVDNSFQIENLSFSGVSQNYDNRSNSSIDVISIPSINPNINIVDTNDSNTSNFVRSMDAIRNNEFRSLDYNTLSNMFSNLDRRQDVEITQEVNRLNNAILRAMDGNGRGY